MTGAKTTRVVSLQIGLLVLLGLWLFYGATGTPGGVLASALGGLLLGVAILARVRGTEMGLTIANVLVPFIALVFLAALGLSALDTVAMIMQADPTIAGIAKVAVRDLGLSIASGVVVLGAVGTVEHGIGDRGVSLLTSTAIGTAIVVVAVLGGFVYMRSAILPTADISVLQLAPFREQLLDPATPGAALLINWGMFIMAALMGQATVSSVPMVELAPRRYEDQLQKVGNWIGSWLGISAILAFISGVLAVLVFSPETGSEMTILESMRQTMGAESTETVIDIFGSKQLRGGLFGVSWVLLAITLVFRGLEYFTGSITSTARRLIPTILGGLTGVAMAFLLKSSVRPTIRRVPSGPRDLAIQAIDMVGPVGILLAVVSASIILLIVGLFLFSVAGGIRFVPSRGAGGALAATGLGFGAIIMGLGDSSPLTAFTMIGLSIIVWNIGQRGVKTHSELEASPPLTLETLHSLGGFIGAVPAIGLAWILYTTTLPSITLPEGTFVGVLVSLVVLTVLLVTIDG